MPNFTFQLISARSRGDRAVEDNSSWHFGLSRRYAYVVIENNMDRCVEIYLFYYIFFSLLSYYVIFIDKIFPEENAC